jgi:hypothetical protein
MHTDHLAGVLNQYIIRMLAQPGSYRVGISNQDDPKPFVGSRHNGALDILIRGGISTHSVNRYRYYFVRHKLFLASKGRESIAI